MLRVYKYDLPYADCFKFELELPIGAKILTAKAQYGIGQLWALVDPEAEIQRRTFLITTTGHAIIEGPEELVYIDTMLFLNDSYVSHLFEVLK